MSRGDFYRNLMGVTQCAFNWSAEQFWRSTSYELWSLFEARERENARMADI